MKKSKYVMVAVFMFVVSLLTYHFQSKVSATVPYTNSRVNLDSSGGQADGNSASSSLVSFSKDGRYITFSSAATNLVSGDTNGKHDIFVHDTLAGTNVRANVSTTGTQENTENVLSSKISANGRFVLFYTADPNMVSGDTNSMRDLFIRDLQTNTTEMITVSSSGAMEDQSAGSGFGLSADGRYVVFSSAATNLVSGDTNGVSDVFVRDRKLGTTTLMSKSDTGSIGNNSSIVPSISCDGSIVAFNSTASNLVPSDTNGNTDTFIVERIGSDHVSDITPMGNGGSNSTTATSISCDGGTVAFTSTASNLVPNDTNATYDLFAYDTSSQVIERINVASSGTEANSNMTSTVGLSNDGRYVAFATAASNLVSGDTNAVTDVFLRDRKSGTTERVSMRNASTQTTTYSLQPTISADGKYVAFVSNDSGLVSGDTDAFEDVFVASSGTSICAQ